MTTTNLEATRLSVETAAAQAVSGAMSIVSPRRRRSIENRLADIPETSPSLPTSPIPPHLMALEIPEGDPIFDYGRMQTPDGEGNERVVAQPPTTPGGGVVQSTLHRESAHASLESVMCSRKIRSQFIIELAVRFAMLSNLKILDSTIDSKHLEIGEKLGGGTFGTVCKAKLRGLDVAVKQLNSGTLTPESILALKIEVEILSKLRHPNIVLFIGISLTPTFAAMVTEWCERGSLLDMLKSHTEKISARTCLKLALDIARGMWYLHSSERLLIIHRDLKSPNVLISLAGDAKVADFGLAVMKERLASDEHDHEFHGNAGTLQWMAPEIIRREEYGQKVDVYSFGITLTELLTRRTPFRDTYRELEFKDAVLEKNERPTIPFWATTGKSAASESHKLGELVMECTEMDPQKRPDFAHIIDILEGLFFTLEHNEIRAFEDYDLPRWLECLDGGDFDEVTHAANEIADVLESVRDGKALHGEEKRLIFLQHVKPFIKCCLSRVGYGKAAKLKEDGGEYEYENLSSQVIANLVRTIALLVAMTMDGVKEGLVVPNPEEERTEEFVLNSAASSSSLLSASSSTSARNSGISAESLKGDKTQDPEFPLTSLFPFTKLYQLEALVDLFLDADERAEKGKRTIDALLVIFRSPMMRFSPHLLAVLEDRLELRLLESKTANLSLMSGASTTMLEDESLLLLPKGDEPESKDLSETLTNSAISFPNASLSKHGSPQAIGNVLNKCQRYGLLPSKFTEHEEQSKQDETMDNESSLEAEIERLEKELVLKKKRLGELKRDRELEKIPVAVAKQQPYVPTETDKNMV